MVSIRNAAVLVLGLNDSGRLVEYKVHYYLGKCHNYQTYDGIDESVFGITNPAAITTRGDVTKSTIDDHDNRYGTDNY